MSTLRTLAIVVLLRGLASAQPSQAPDPMAEIERQQEETYRQISAKRDEDLREMNREYDERAQRNDEDFNRTALYAFGGFVGFIVLIGVFGSFSYAKRRRLALSYADTPTELAPLVTPGWGGFDVCTLRIAIDGRASKFVQTELTGIMKQYDRASQDSRARCLRETSIMLRRVRDSWMYGGADNEPMRPEQETLAAYQKLVDDARTRITRSKGNSPATTEGDDVILVSIIVATRGELATITDLATGEDLRRALESAVDRAAADVLALDIVWDPAEEGRTLSSADLEAAYRTSELHRLAGTTAGKTFCTYCGGPFPIELVTCPHCGAPAREARAV